MGHFKDITNARYTIPQSRNTLVKKQIKKFIVTLSVLVVYYKVTNQKVHAIKDEGKQAKDWLSFFHRLCKALLAMTKEDKAIKGNFV